MEIVLILLVVIVANAVGTLTGFGLSTVMIPVMVLFYPLAEALLFVGIVHWFGDVWKLVLFREGIRWKLILSFGFPGIIAAIVGASLVFSISGTILSRVLGAFLVLYVAFLLVRSSFQVPARTSTSAVGGALSGFFAGIFGMGGAIRAMFLTAFNLPKSVYLATIGAIALAIDTSRLITYLYEGTRLTPRLAWGMLLFVPASFLGARIAKRFVNRIPQQNFRKVLAVFLLLVGIRLLIWPK
jgi:uncharacterized protein